MSQGALVAMPACRYQVWASATNTQPLYLLISRRTFFSTPFCNTTSLILYTVHIQHYLSYTVHCTYPTLPLLYCTLYISNTTSLILYTVHIQHYLSYTVHCTYPTLPLLYCTLYISNTTSLILYTVHIQHYLSYTVHCTYPTLPLLYCTLYISNTTSLILYTVHIQHYLSYTVHCTYPTLPLLYCTLYISNTIGPALADLKLHYLGDAAGLSSTLTVFLVGMGGCSLVTCSLVTCSLVTVTVGGCSALPFFSSAICTYRGKKTSHLYHTAFLWFVSSLALS